MAKTYNKMQIDMNGDILSSVTAVAQDTLSRYLDCNLYNNGVTLDLTGHMAQLYIKKPEPDGLTVLTQGEITDAAAGRVQFELTNQALAETGWIELQIVLTSGEGEVLSSEIFKLHVLPSIRSDEAIESTNEFGALVVLFQEIQNSLDLMKAIVDAFGKPGVVSEKYGVSTFWGILEAAVKANDLETVFKKYLNSTIDEPHFLTLDKLLGAKILCKGYVGTVFTISRTNGDGLIEPFDVTLTDSSRVLDNGLSMEIIPVPIGAYTLNIDFYGMTSNVEVSLPATGNVAEPQYELSKVLGEFTESGAFTMPSGITNNQVVITATAAGAGGSKSVHAGYDFSGATGGAGGGAGEHVINAEYTITPGTVVQITVGKGGSSDVAGGATVVGSLFTLAGGEVKGGFAGGRGGTAYGFGNTADDGAAGGGERGGAAGEGVELDDYAHSGGGGGGQGENGLGAGGDGGDGGQGNSAGEAGANGTRGGGGGGAGGYGGRGGSPSSKTVYGGKGGDGYVLIRAKLDVA